MVEDIAPGILKNLEDAIAENTADRRAVTRLLVKSEKGNVSFQDANEYARLRGEIVRNAIGKIDGSDLPNGTMYYNIASRTLKPVLEDMAEDVLDFAKDAMQSANSAAGIGIKPIVPDMSDNIHRLTEKATADLWDDVRDEVSTAAETLSRKCVDETIRQNAEWQNQAGMNPKIERTASSGACQWCADRAGSYDYETVKGSDDIFGRHANCDCVIDFFPGKGKARERVSDSSYRQNRDSLSPEERERRAEEGLYRRDSNTGDFAELQENMQLRHVRSVVKDIDSAERNVRYIINRDKELIGREFFGYTNPDGNEITLYPDAFTNRETLVKTIGHESVHVRQYQDLGPVKDNVDASEREKEAYGAEDSIWAMYLERTRYNGK